MNSSLSVTREKACRYLSRSIRKRTCLLCLMKSCGPLTKTLAFRNDTPVEESALDAHLGTLGRIAQHRYGLSIA